MLDAQVDVGIKPSVDRAWISVGKGEPCNWCGKSQPHTAETKINQWLDLTPPLIEGHL